MASQPHSPGLHPRYEMLEIIGRGGMGVVYKARDLVEGKVVALKTLHPEPEAASASVDQRRFDREIRVLSLLHHEGIVKLRDVGRWEGHTYFTMELLAGLPLQAFLGGPRPDAAKLPWILKIALRILEALEHLHRSGLVHRDLKPSNIMVLAAEGETLSTDALSAEADPRVKLLDFGLVKPRERDQAGARPAPGTPLYMAPEQMDPSAPPEPRSDLYSLGVVLYQFLTGRLPHATVASALSGKPPPPPSQLNPACPAELSEILLCLLEPQPHRRFSSAFELAARLRALVPGRAEPSEGPALPPRPEGARLLEPAFAGRAEILAALREELHRAGLGNGRLVAVSGGRGSGKTWLLERSGLKAQAVLEHGLTYFQGRYTAGGPPHQGLAEVAQGLVLDLLRELGPAALGEALGPWRNALFDALGLEVPAEPAAPAAPASDAPPAELAAERVVQAALSLFRAAGRRPRLILLDDLHLADELDVAILARLLRGLREMPLLLVATYRPEAVEANPALAAWLGEAAAGDEAANLRQLHLAAFTDGEASQMARSMLSPPADLDPRLLAELLDATGGVPRALEAALLDLWHHRRLRIEDGVWRAAPPAGGPAELDPDSTLPPLEREILLAASVLGESFEPEVLFALLEPAASGDPERPEGREHEILAGLHSLVARGFLRKTPLGFAFARAGLRERIEEELEEERRRSLHARAAEALLALWGEAARDRWDAIAAHFEHGGLREKALEFHLKAAGRAAATYANRRGIAAFRAALALADGPARGVIAAELGRLHSRVGEYEAALACFASAGEAVGGDSLALLDEVGRAHQRRGEFKSARDCYERLLASAGDRPALLARARYLLGGLRFEEGGLDAAAEHFQASLDLFQRLGDSNGMAAAHSGLGLIEKRRESLDAAARHFREAIACAERASSPGAATALNNLGNILSALGRDQEAVDCFRRSLEIRERIGDRAGIGISLNNLSRALGRRGELQSAADAAARALRTFAEVGDRKGVLIANGNLGVFQLFRGDFAGARESFARARAQAERLGDRRALADSLRCLARLENCRREPRAAEAHLRQALAALGGEVDPDLRAGLLSELACCRLTLGDTEGARAAVRQGLEAGAAAPSTGRGLLLLALAQVDLDAGAVRAAVNLAKEALDALEAGGARFDAALAHRELGRAYREMGPDWVDRAEKHLGLALRRFEEMGATFEAAAAARELGDLWLALEEPVEARRFYRQAEQGLRAADAPQVWAEIQEKLVKTGGGKL